MKKFRSGFTLIELLVVIAVIGLLASVVLVALNATRIKARDTKRKADIKQLQTALEFYYDDNNEYPAVGVVNIGYDISALSVPLTPHILSIPSDPSGSGWHTYQYVRGSVSGNPPFGYGIWIRYEGIGYCRTGINMHPAWWAAEACP